MDDPQSVASPASGIGVGSVVLTTPGNDFVAGQVGNGIRVDATGEYVRFAQSDGVTANIDFVRGAVDFWYQPFANHTDGQRRTLVSLGQFGSGAHGIHIEKDARNHLQVYVIDSAVRLKELTLGPTAYGWAPGQWVNLRVTWDFTVAAGTASVHLYVDGVELPPTFSNLSGPLAMPAASSGKHLFLGNRGTNSNSSTPANGILDEVVIYSQPVPPPPPVDTTPPALSNGQPAGTLPAGTTQATLSLSTNESATCRYDVMSGVDYSQMAATFATTGGTNHSTVVTGLSDGAFVTYYVRCADVAGNATLNDFLISFSVAVPDLTPPGISNVQFVNLSTSSVSIVWTTDEPADSQVEYGPTPGYGSFSPLQTALATGHLVSLLSLQQGTTYHYRILSRDAAGNLAVTMDDIFTTASPPPNVYFQTTLDGASAVTAPAVGTGVGAQVLTSPANDFVLAQMGNGIRVDATGEYVRFAQSDGVTANIDFVRGAVDFWYQPFAPHTDGQRRTLVSLGQFGSGAHGIHIEKDQQNQLHVYVIEPGPRLKELYLAPTVYSWVPGQWVNLRLTWDFTVPAGTASVHLYLDGVELPYAFSNLSGPLAMPAASITKHLFLGNRGTNSNSSTPANGILDELVIYSQPIPAVPLVPDTTSPSVAITTPLDGASVAGVVAIDGVATDNVAVARVEFYKDGALLGVDTAAPFQQLWDTIAESNAAHTLHAVAFDSSNNSATSTVVTVAVNNQGTSVPPDIILILADDQRWDTMQYMPLTQAALGSSSVQFTNAFTPVGICCPSRASILTGLYSHNHGVRRNWQNEGGGAPAFDDSSTLATWLQAAGYRTGLYGKYLNDYPKLQPFPYNPPGWSEWHAFVEEATKAYYNYSLAENGTITTYGSAPQDYSTDVLAAKAVQFIESTAPGQPLFLYFTPVAPHGPATPAPQDIGTFAGLAPWRPPSFNEADVTDKQSWVANRPLLDATQEAQADAFRIAQIESLQSVDRAVDAIVAALQRTGRLNNSVIIYASDSGILWGEHRLYDAKECVYDECVRVPLWVRAPGVTGRTDSSLVATIDLAPSLAQMAGVAPPSPVNGNSFVNLLSDSNAAWRTEILLENLGVFASSTVNAIRTVQYHLAEYSAIGGMEFYDLTNDPYQQDNRINDPAYVTVIQSLGKLLAKLKSQ